MYVYRVFGQQLLVISTTCMCIGFLARWLLFVVDVAISMCLITCMVVNPSTTYTLQNFTRYVCIPVDIAFAEVQQRKQPYLKAGLYDASLAFHFVSSAIVVSSIYEQHGILMIDTDERKCWSRLEFDSTVRTPGSDQSDGPVFFHMILFKKTFDIIPFTF